MGTRRKRHQPPNKGIHLQLLQDQLMTGMRTLDRRTFDIQRVDIGNDDETDASNGGRCRQEMGSVACPITGPAENNDENTGHRIASAKKNMSHIAHSQMCVNGLHGNGHVLLVISCVSKLAHKCWNKVLSWRLRSAQSGSFTKGNQPEWFVRQSPTCTNRTRTTLSSP